MMMMSRFRVNFPSHVAGHLTGGAGREWVCRLRRLTTYGREAASRGLKRRAELSSSRLVACREPVIEGLGDALRDAAPMIAMRSRDAPRLLTNALPLGSVISWFRSSFSHKQEKKEPAMASPALRSDSFTADVRPERSGDGSIARDVSTRYREHARNPVRAIEGRAVVVGVGAARAVWSGGGGIRPVHGSHDGAYDGT